MVNKISNDEEIRAIWESANTVTMKRLKFPDHGPKHIEIVASSGLKIMGILNESGISPSIVTDYGKKYEDAEIVLLVASALHDAGNAVHRKHHEQIGMIISRPIINRLLSGAGYDLKERVLLEAEILSAILSHSEDKVKPLTIEAGILRVADALDIERGRAKISFEQLRDMHNIATMAINKVEILRGSEKPVLVEIRMNSSAGVFLLDRVVRKKLFGSGIEKYIEIHALVENKNEIINEFWL